MGKKYSNLCYKFWKGKSWDELFKEWEIDDFRVFRKQSQGKFYKAGTCS